MSPFSAYRRMLCVCGIFWFIGLALVYFYFNDFPRQSMRSNNILKLGLGFSNVDSSESPVSVDDDDVDMSDKQPRGDDVIAMTKDSAGYPAKGSIVVKMVAPHMIRKHSRLAEYCNLPNKETTGEEGRLTVSDSYELLSVHVITRHGDRASFNKFKGQVEAQLPCTLDKQYMTSNKKFARFETIMRLYTKNQDSNSRFKNWALYPNNAICRPGDLTGTGVLQHIVLGDFLRRRYLTTLFPHGIKPDSDLSIKSTETVRTYQSVVAFLYGFLPSFNLNNLNIERVRPNMCDSDNPEIPCFCSESVKYYVAYEQFATKHYRLDKSYQRVVRQISDIYGISANQVPLNLWTILDPVMVHACHDLPIKCNHAGRCIDGRLIDNFWRIHDDKQWAINHPNKFLQKEAALVYYPLLNKIIHHMKQINDGVQVPRFAVYSGHDMTLSGILTSLAAFDGKWSKYAGRVVFEHYRNSAENTYHTRLLRDGVDVTNQTSFCKHLQPGQLCLFSKFEDFIKKGLLKELFGDQPYKDLCSKGA